MTKNVADGGSISGMMLRYDIKAKHLVVKGKKYVLYDVLPIRDVSPDGLLDARRSAKKVAKKLRLAHNSCVRIYPRPHGTYPHIRLYMKKI
jgi:hypothetical protein